ncbi:MAG TPA: hypothetical protein VKU02_00355, partial [Gemmataceae bacterium]|nr:hypothetical protein [Gemmataceae bacterium]
VPLIPLQGKFFNPLPVSCAIIGVESLEETYTMSEQPSLDKPDLRTDGQKFEDAMRSILRAPKKEVMAQLAAEKEERKRERADKKQ